MFILNSTLLDFAKPYQFGFQKAASPVMEALINLHNHVMFYLTGVLVFTFGVLSYILYTHTISTHPIRQYLQIKVLYKGQISHHAFLEFVWTVLPTVILLAIAMPSFALLYAMDANVSHYMTLKVIGHQWYWSYEYTLPSFITSNPDIPTFNIKFDSYMVPTEELKPGQLRLLSTDNPVILPLNKYIKVEVTASDVLHSWAVPALGVKIDAVPGRSNEITVFIDREGTYFGQCSELCGVNHGFMPIEIVGTSFDLFNAWVILSDGGWDMLRREFTFYLAVLCPNIDYPTFRTLPLEYTRSIRNAFFEDGEHRVSENFFTEAFKAAWKDYPFTYTTK